MSTVTGLGPAHNEHTAQLSKPRHTGRELLNPRKTGQAASSGLPLSAELDSSPTAAPLPSQPHPQGTRHGHTATKHTGQRSRCRQFKPCLEQQGKRRAGTVRLCLGCALACTVARNTAHKRTVDACETGKTHNSAQRRMLTVEKALWKVHAGGGRGGQLGACIMSSGNDAK